MLKNLAVSAAFALFCGLIVTGAIENSMSTAEESACAQVTMAGSLPTVARVDDIIEAKKWRMVKCEFGHYAGEIDSTSKVSSLNR